MCVYVDAYYLISASEKCEIDGIADVGELEVANAGEARRVVQVPVEQR